MAKVQRKGYYKAPISLLLVEGETDEVFYYRIKESCLVSKKCRVTIHNLKGLFNVNDLALHYNLITKPTQVRDPAIPKDGRLWTGLP